MKRLATLASGVVLFLGSIWTPVSGGDKGEKKADSGTLVSEYYPLKKGNTWEYLSGGKKIVVKVADVDTIDIGDSKIPCARVETDGGVVTEHLTVKQDGVYRVRSNGQDIKPAVMILKLPPKKGDSWPIDSMVQNFAMKGKLTTSGPDALEVGKSKYDAFSVKSSDLMIGGQSATMEAWFAKDVGMVKQRFKLPNADLEVVLELEKFTPGK
jgi:hypothetical protein